MTTNKIRLNFTAVCPDALTLQCSDSNFPLANFYHQNNYKAEFSGNVLTVSSPYGNEDRYVVSFDVDGLVALQLPNPWPHGTYRILNNIAKIQIMRIVRYINAGL